MVWLKTKKYLWLVLNWKWLWPCCFGICPMSAGRKVQNMSPFCRQKGTEFVHSLPAERGPGLLFTSTHIHTILVNVFRNSFSIFIFSLPSYNYHFLGNFENRHLFIWNSIIVYGEPCLSNITFLCNFSSL